MKFMKKMTDVRSLITYYASTGFEALGGELAALEMLHRLRESNELSRTQYSRLKATIIKLARYPYEELT